MVAVFQINEFIGNFTKNRSILYFFQKGLQKPLIQIQITRYHLQETLLGTSTLPKAAYLIRFHIIQFLLFQILMIISLNSIKKTIFIKLAN